MAFVECTEVWGVSIDRRHEQEIEKDCDSTSCNQIHEANSQGEDISFYPEVPQQYETVYKLYWGTYGIDYVNWFVVLAFGYDNANKYDDYSCEDTSKHKQEWEWQNLCLTLLAFIG